MTQVWISLAVYLGPLITLLILGFITGSIAERRHLKDLAMRENAVSAIALTNISNTDSGRGELVTGSTVIAYDFYRRIAILFRKLIGGRFRMHEKMMERARREAVLRMVESAQSQGAKAVHNIRIVTSNLGNSDKGAGGCEVLAYGTAVFDAAAHP